MRRRRRLSASVLLAALLLELCGVPAAGSAQAASLEVVELDISSHPDVAVTVTAPRELAGRDLGPEHFTIREDGAEVPVSVRRLPGDGLDVALVIDTSGSMRGEPLAAAKEAAVGFVDAMPAGTRIAVLGFGDQPSLAGSFSADATPVVEAVEALEARGETALYDAVALTGEALTGVSDPGERQLMVVLSDGGDTASARSLDEAVAELEELDVGFHAVALATAESDLGALGRLASASGGKVVAASEPAEIVGLYDAIASQLRNQYELAFTSEAGGTTSLHVGLDADGVSAAWEAPVAFPEPSGAAAAAESAGSPAPPPPVVAAPVVAPEPAWYAQPWLLTAGVTAFGLSLLIGGWLFFSGRHSRELARRVRSVDAGARASALVGGMAEQATALAERAVSGNERLGRLDVALERAGLAMRPAEYVVMVVSAVLGGASVALLAVGPVAALVVGVLLSVAAWQGLDVLRRRRQRKLADQLGDTIQLLAGSLRSGHGLVQAIDMVTREAESPTAEEFHRVIVESRLGRDVGDALDALAERAGNEDVEWVVQAIRIHREVGGDLAEILDRVGETIRDRNRVRGQIRSLTAEGRLSAILLMALPFLVGTWMWFTNRPYISELFTRPAGRVVLGVGVVLMTIGAAVMKRLVRPEF